MEISDEIELAKYNKERKQFNDFVAELKAVVAKYNFKKYESDNYNGMEEWCGTDYHYIMGTGNEYEILWNPNIKEMLIDIFGEFEVMPEE